MGLITGLLTLPMAPVRGAVWVARQLKQQAEQEYYNPAVIRQQLAEVDDAHAAGELTDEQRDELQRQLLGRIYEAQQRPTEEM
ncbi:hypothetical protein GCM10011581_25660 [Saccharopolyspora subtropica]|uniref:Gas vesicle protein GvpG n=1 Tax=Saccharopolyspora thermophila TaxID=89367 RepID=A0A917JVT0_9PSEU|nr:c-type cytochrome biogenesis protein CcmI [Saccharopolyspora subtropica]GGI87425.1 hypothetical protein GCM10011581_25660 [Saccharopolyspora subtropica]